MLAARFGAIAAAGEAAALPALLGSWPLSESSGTTFADATGGNTAFLNVPIWTTGTHEYRRKGIATGLADFSLEVSNGGPSIPLIAGYRQSAMSLALWINPLGGLRGRQYWDENDERHGREFLALCDNGQPGSFAIERRWHKASNEHRLDGWVRDGSGTAQRFSGGIAGIAGALLPVDTSQRIVLTEGPAGAQLWLDGSKVATLPGVTAGWTALSGSIHISMGNSTGHANERSPFWGRVQEIQVYQGQLGSTEVSALPAALQSRLWQYPSDFVGGATDINIANYGPNDGGQPARAHAAAAAAGRYVYQADGDTAWYIASDQGGDNGITWANGCKGFIGLKLKRPNSQNGQFERIINGQFLTTNPYGNRKLIGCQLDGNARGQNWHPKTGMPDFSLHAFGLQHAHLLYVKGAQTYLVDACDFMDDTGDGISADEGTTLTATSCRFWGTFRGSVVLSQQGATASLIRAEALGTSRPGFGTLDPGSGITDLETTFGGSGTVNLTIRDAWYDSDWDEVTGGGGTLIHANMHAIGGALWVDPQADGGAPASWRCDYCTIAYHHAGGNSAGTYPPAKFKGFPAMGGEGCLFDNCVFVANGDPYYYHESHLVIPGSTQPFRIDYESAGTQTRLWTMRNCQFRAKNLPGGLATSNVQAINHPAGLGTSRSVEFDGVTIDAAFADLPFAMGGMTVRYRNVLHERTGSVTPWSGAGAEVAL